MVLSTRTPAFWLALVASFTLIASEALQWTLVDLLTVFRISDFEVLVGLVFASVLLASLANLVIRRNALPALICSVALVVALFAPWSTISLHTDFWLKRAAREQVVADLDAGKYQPNGRNLIKTPFGLSAGGDEAEVIDCGASKCVYFFTFRGIGNASGFLYVPPDIDPQSFDWLSVKAWEGNWYWASVL